VTYHKILEGDARDLLPGFKPGRVHCVVTDPPYGVNFVSRRAETPEGKAWVKPVANDGDIDGALALFQEVMSLVVPTLADEADLYVFTRWDIVDVWMDAVRNIDPSIHYKMLLIWDKGIPGMGDIDANWGCGHELILYCKKGRRDVAYRRSGIIAVDKVHTSQLIHPTEKPVALLEKLIEMSTAKGDLVLDPFSGSGSAVVAARNLGRSAIGIELDPLHVKRSTERLSQDTFI
jgi:adenine-specific DNA-methyltransferase